MSKSNASKGTYYRNRTKEFFEKAGYHVVLLEKLQRIYVRGRVVFKKQDVWGSDGMMSDGKELIFWNSKFGRDHIAEGIKEFNDYPWPSSIKLWIVVWEYRAREPDIISVPRSTQPQLI